MDRLRAMSILSAVAEAGSLTAAGRRLGVPVQTVSRQLLELEAHLGARLLRRTTRKLEWTETGTRYVAACRRILDELAEAEREAAGEYAAPRGSLTLTAPVGFGRMHVAPVAASFLAAFPEIDVRLALSDRNLHLLEDHIDLAVRIGALADSAMVAVQAGVVRSVVCGSPGFFATHGVPATPDDLASLPCVTFDALEPATAWSFGGARSVAIRSRFSVNSAEAAIEAAVAGLGLTRVLSYQAAPALVTGALTIVLESYEPAPRPVSLLYPAQGALPLKTRSFIDFALPRLRESLLRIG